MLHWKGLVAIGTSMSFLNNEQAQYINTLRVEHPDIEGTTLIASLKGAGWTQSEIDEALTLYRSTPVATSAPIPPPKEVPPVVQNPTPIVTETTPLYVSEATVPSVQTIQKKSHVLIWILFSLLLLSAVGAGAYYAVFKTNLLNAPKLTNEQLLQNLFAKLQGINTTNYAVDFSFTVADRDQGALPFNEDTKLSDEELLKYKRDQDRIRDIVTIKNALQARVSVPYGNTSLNRPLYPKTLTGVVQVTADPLGVPYKYAQIDKGMNYELTVNFETTDAAMAVRANLYNTTSLSTENTGNTIVLTSSDYVYENVFNGKPTQPKLLGLFDVASLESYLPDNLDIQFHMGGTVDKTQDKPVNAQMELSGEASFGDASFAFSAEGIKKEETYYGIIHKMPTFFKEMSALRGKWVRITEADIVDYGYESNIQEILQTRKSEQKARIVEMQDNFRKALQIADTRNLVTIGSGPEKVTIDNEVLSRYTLNVAYENLLPFYEDTMTLLASSSTHVRQDDIFIEYLKGKDAEKIFAYLKANVTLELFMNKEGYPAKIVLRMRYVPTQSAEVLKDKQLNLTFTFSFRDINKPVVVTEPQTSITFDEFMSQITGNSKEEILLQRQEMNLMKLRDALRYYHDWTGAYPDSLNELTKLRSEVTKKSTDSVEDPYRYSSIGSYDAAAFMRSIPKDVFTKAEYIYTKNSDDYKLTYSVTLVPFTTKVNPANYYTFYTAPPKGSDSKTYERISSWDSGSSIFVLKFKNGENVATAQALSEVSFDITDSDKDTLSDPLEAVLTTDPRNVDTDSDGVKDKDEILSGSNPIGPGRLEFRRESFGF